jgi:hypothetical protein
VTAVSEPPAPQVTTQTSEADPNTVGLPAAPPQEGE